MSKPEKTEVILHGLTRRQMNFLDKMWSFQTTEEMEEWLDTLKSDDLMMVDTLRELVFLEVLDVEMGTDYSAARKVINKFMLQ